MKYQFDNKNHVHTLDGVALTGTSSIGNVLAKPALIPWAVKMATDYIEAHVVTGHYSMAPKVGSIEFDMPFNDLIKEAKAAHRKKKESAAVAGTDLHAELERYVKDTMHVRSGVYDSKIQPFIDWSVANVKQFIASEAHCFHQDLFVGGITDCVAELNDGKLAVIDFKSSKEAYTTQFIQAGGYAVQIEKNGLFSEDGEHSKKLDRPIEALIVVPFGAKKVVPEVKYNSEDYKNGFRHAVALYRLLGLDK